LVCTTARAYICVMCESTGIDMGSLNLAGLKSRRPVPQTVTGTLNHS
jgi:hypothetical protein